VPQPNAEEVRLLLTGSGEGADRTGPIIRAADHLLAVCAHLDGSVGLPTLRPPLAQTVRWISETTIDLSDVRGQLQAKRALTVAAAGSHSLLMRGPPGAGKSMLAMRLPDVSMRCTRRSHAGRAVTQDACDLMSVKR
jgi:magnesium chelatase family protein